MIKNILLHLALLSVPLCSGFRSEVVITGTTLSPNFVRKESKRKFDVCDFTNFSGVNFIYLYQLRSLVLRAINLLWEGGNIAVKPDEQVQIVAQQY